MTGCLNIMIFILAVCNFSRLSRSRCLSARASSPRAKRGGVPSRPSLYQTSGIRLPLRNCGSGCAVSNRGRNSGLCTALRLYGPRFKLCLLLRGGGLHEIRPKGVTVTALLPFHYPRPQHRFSLTAEIPVHEHVHKCPALIAQARASTPSLTPRLGWVAC